MWGVGVRVGCGRAGGSWQQWAGSNALCRALGCTQLPRRGRAPSSPQDASYQQWYDEAAHPLRKQRLRPGGLEAAWAAVLGGGSGASLVQQQLPRTLLAASVSMPWDAAACACLRLLRALLAAAAGSAEQQLEPLLRRAFGRQQRETGARVATRTLGYWESGSISKALATAAAAPVGGTLVLLCAQLLGLTLGQDYFQPTMAHAGEAAQGNADGSGRLVAPPLLEAYAAMLGLLLPHAQLEVTRAPAPTPGVCVAWPPIQHSHTFTPGLAC